MRKISKISALTLTLILAMSCLTSLAVKPANAQTIPKPSVPEFTVSFVDRSYTTPKTTAQTTDPFTGKLETHTTGGQYIENKTIDVKIKNQPYSPIELPNGTVAQLFYTVRTKGHFASWTSFSSSNDDLLSRTGKQAFASTSDYTTISFIVGSENDVFMGKADVYIPDGGQEDFQVKAESGYHYQDYGGGNFPIQFIWKFASIAESGWSNIQTISIPDGSVTVSASSSPTPLSSPTPSVPEFSAIILLPLLLFAFAIALVLKHR